MHHIGGRNHAPYYTIPLCYQHHEQVTRAIANAAPNLMEYTNDVEERKRRSRMAAYIFLWHIDDAVTNETKTEEQL